MRTKGWFTFPKFSRFTRSVGRQINRKGQALVEFTLCFILLLVIAWIPADFGLAFYTSQLAGNAAREGARIAAADPNLFTSTGSCVLKTDCFSKAPGTLLYEIAKRSTTAMLSNPTITVATSGTVTGCDAVASVTVAGNYPFSFYRMLRWFGAAVNPSAPISRTVQMRYEHQC
jgi:Flp pilus assembly protein TadG